MKVVAPTLVALLKIMLKEVIFAFISLVSPYFSVLCFRRKYKYIQAYCPLVELCSVGTKSAYLIVRSIHFGICKQSVFSTFP